MLRVSRRCRVDSCGALQRHAHARAQPLVQVSQWVYTVQGVDVDALAEELRTGLSAAKSLFSLPAAYVAPREMGYELPTAEVKEVAFVGRSNVGKSLVGAVLGRPDIVKVSKQPGRTRSVSYFALGNASTPRMYCVDMPGYGYAKASKTDRKQWMQTATRFLAARPPSTLMRTYVLIDARHGPLKADLELVQLIRGCGVPYQLLLTKVDLCSPTELRASLAKTTPIMSMSGCFPVEILTSSKTGTGLEELKATIALLA